MLVLFLNFALVLSVLISQTLSAAENKQVALKDQLARSITHVSDILVDIEHKIGRERKILAQMDTDLNALRDPTNKFITKEAAPSISNLTTLPANWITTTSRIIQISPYMADVLQHKATKNYGYFSSFIDEFSELVFTKEIKVSYPVVALVEKKLKKGINEGKFNSVDDDLLNGLLVMMLWFEALTPARVKEQAEHVHYLMKFKDNSLSTNMNNLINFYDKMFTDELGHALYQALEVFNIYPAENISLLTVGEGIYQAAIAPYSLSEGTRKQKRLNQYLLKAVLEYHPHFRSQTEASQSLVILFNDHTQAALPERRSMNYRQVVKHFLLKHPIIFKKIKRQYKYDKKNKNHHLFYKQKRHHYYGKNRGRYHRHGHVHEREPITQRAYTDIRSKQENDEVDEDSGKSGAYFGGNPGRENHQQKNMHKVQSTQIRKQKIDKQRQRKLLTGTRTDALSIEVQPHKEQFDSQYFKQLAIRLLSKRQQSQDFFKNRRFNIPSAEEDICNHSQYIQDSIENSKLLKIREVSSYSDEEDRLRMNLYYALRHGNRRFESFRRSGDDIINKKSIQDLSSDPDDEWVLKNNIYKVFEQVK